MKKILPALIIFIFNFLLMSEAFAADASLFLSPENGNYRVGSQFSIKVKVNSDGAPINAAKSEISFSTNLLEVQSLSKSGSIFSLWPEEPTFSNSKGQISFAGGVPAPGFTGVGTILTINFRAKKAGEAKPSFNNGQVLAADGRGTNILSFTKGGIYLLSGIEEFIPEVSSLPATPVITSPTHPKEELWYNNPNPKFQWKMSSDIIGVATEFDQKAGTLPSLKSEGVFDSKTYEKVEDGIWYFHLRIQNKFGWSETARYKVKIDTKPPNNFDITIDNGGDRTNPSPDLYFEAKDDMSEISHYEIKIGDGEIFSVVLGKINPYHLPLQTPGSYNILVKAVDQAGNSTESKTLLEIDSIPPPEILVYPKNYTASKDIFYVEGRALPNSTVLIFLKKDEKLVKNWEALSDKDGNWSFSTEELIRSGDYLLFAKTKDHRGAISNPSQEYNVKVILFGISIGSWLISYPMFFLILIIIIILLALSIVYIFFSRIRKDENKLMKEVKEAEESLKNNFDKLREDLKLRIEYFDLKPGLSPEEKKLRDEIFYFLKSTEEAIAKEIKDIEKKLE